MSLNDKLQRVTGRFEELSSLLAGAEALPPVEFARLSKEYSELAPVVDAIAQLQRAKAEAAEMEQLINDGATDARNA